MLFKSQQKAPVLHASGPDTFVVTIKDCEDVSTQQFSSVLYILIMVKSG